MGGEGETMRGTWLGVVLTLLLTACGCLDKPKRVIRQPQPQLYDLPPTDMEQFSKPPTYPEEKRVTPEPKKDNTPPMNGMRGGGGMPGPGMGGGGAGVGNPGAF
jgi:hypothetical protein